MYYVLSGINKYYDDNEREYIFGDYDHEVVKFELQDVAQSGDYKALKIKRYKEAPNHQQLVEEGYA